MREIQAHNSWRRTLVPITHLRRIRRFALGKSTLPTPPPERQGLCAVIASELACGLDQDAQDHGAIVISQHDQIGFHDQSAKRDEMARALAALHLPVALGETCVMTRLAQL